VTTGETGIALTAWSSKLVSVMFRIDGPRLKGNDNSAVKLSKDEEDDWYSLQPLGVQFEDCTPHDSALEICGILSDVRCQINI
jgi:hypothetical protein